MRATQIHMAKAFCSDVEPLSNAIPLLLGCCPVPATLTTPSTIVLSIIIVLPTAFRIWAVVLSTRDWRGRLYRGPCLPRPTKICPSTASSPRSIAKRSVVDQLLTAIERLDYPAEKLDVIVAVEADDPANPRRLSPPASIVSPSR